MNAATVYTALFARLQTTPGIVTFSKRLKLPDEIEPSQTPFLALIPEDQTSEMSDRGLPLKWRLRFTAYVMVHDAGPDGPIPTLQTLIDAVRDALNATATERAASARTDKFTRAAATTTLAGTVSHTQVTAVQTDGGALSDTNWSVAQVQIEVLATH